MMNFSDDNVMLLILCHKEFSLEYGITPDHVSAAGCYAYDLAALYIAKYQEWSKGYLDKSG